MTSRSRQEEEPQEPTRDEEAQAPACGPEQVTSKPTGKVRGSAPPLTDLVTDGRSRSHRLAKDSLPLRRGQRGRPRP